MRHFINSISERSKKTMFGYFTFLFTIVGAYIFISQQAGSFRWHTEEINALSALSAFGVQTILMYKWAIGAAVLVLIILWSGSALMGWTYGSDTSRIVLIVVFFIVLIMGTVDTRQGGFGNDYVWQNSYMYTGYSYIGHSWWTDLAISMMNTRDAEGNLDGTTVIIGLCMIALLVAMFPKGWFIALAMIITMMYFISVSEDLVPWLMSLRRNQLEE